MSKIELSGIEAFLEVLSAAGVRYVFGNPGSTELPLNDALVDDPRFHYIFGLQEVPLTAMADCPANARRSPWTARAKICPRCARWSGQRMVFSNVHTRPRSRHT